MFRNVSRRQLKMLRDSLIHRHTNTMDQSETNGEMEHHVTTFVTTREDRNGQCILVRACWPALWRVGVATREFNAKDNTLDEAPAPDRMAWIARPVRDGDATLGLLPILHHRSSPKQLTWRPGGGSLPGHPGCSHRLRPRWARWSGSCPECPTNARSLL